MKKILVPVDFTDYSANAMRMAAYIARKKGMSVKLLHLIEDPDNPLKKISGDLFSKNKEREEEYYAQLTESTEEHLRRMAELIRTDELEAEYEVRRTKKSIAKEITSEKCDLIVMGRKRSENDESIWFGSIAEKVIRLSAIPVLTVGILEEDFKLNDIVFAVDFEEKESKQVIERVIHFSELIGANLRFLSIQLHRATLSEKQAENRVNDLIKDFDLKGREVDIYISGSLEEGIFEYSQVYKPDLLILCTHGRKGLLHFLAGSIAESMMGYVSVPVLTYNISKTKIDRTIRPVTRDQIITIRKREERR